MRFVTLGFIVLVGVATGIYGCRRDAENAGGATAVDGEFGAQGQAPYFEVDPLWPKPLPNHWLLGAAVGVSVDERDHIWIIHRSSSTLDDNEKGLELMPPRGECCAGAPPVLEFDRDGTLVGNWGGPGTGYEWPQSNHGITADIEQNVWIGGNGPGDAHVLKFSRDGSFRMQAGRMNARRGPDNAQGEPTYAGGSNDKQ